MSANNGSETWIPESRLIFWARVVVFGLSIGVAAALALWTVSDRLASGAIALGVAAVVFALSRLWLEAGRSEAIPNDVRRRLRVNIVLFGPVAALQVLIHHRQPGAGFSGLAASKRSSAAPERSE